MDSSSGPNLMPSCGQICAVGDFAFDGRESGGMAQFVARKNRLQRDRRLRALVRRDVRVQRGNDFVRRRLFVLQIRNDLDAFQRRPRRAPSNPWPRGNPRASGPATRFPAPERPPARFFSVGTMKWPSFFISRLAVSHHFFQSSRDHVRHEHVLDLIRRRLAAKTVQHQFDQIRGDARPAGGRLRGRRPCARECGFSESA